MDDHLDVELKQEIENISEKVNEIMKKVEALFPSSTACADLTHPVRPTDDIKMPI
jgi:hypothetical protein